MNAKTIGTATYTNSKGETKPLVTVATVTGNPRPYRVMVRGVEQSAWVHKGLALVAAQRIAEEVTDA